MPQRPWQSAVLAAATLLLGWKCGGPAEPPGDFWSPMSTAGAPTYESLCSRNAIVWAGNEALLFAQPSGGGRYDPATDTWRPMSSDGAPLMGDCVAVWTGSEAILYGHYALPGGEQVASAARYDPALDAWSPVSLAGVPVLWSPSAVRTGTEVILWGNDEATGQGNGARYDPATGTWSTLSTLGAPGPPQTTTAVWTGSEMIAWSCLGVDRVDCLYGMAEGGRYDPVTDVWSEARLPECCDGVTGYESIWTGQEMLLWGEGGPAVYDPVADVSRALPLDGAPTPYDHAVVWTGSEMLVWGWPDAGGRYDPVTETWTPMTTLGEPPRMAPAFTWTGTELIVWGDPDPGGGMYGTMGGRYTP